MPKKIINYQVITGTTSLDISTNILAEIIKGWKPFSNLVVTSWVDKVQKVQGSGHFVTLVYYLYAQPMILEES